METKSPGFEDIDQYIAMFSSDVRARLEEIRATIRAAAPDAVEKISYQIPTYFQHGNLVHFAAFKKHIGFYPGAAAIEQFSAVLAGYHCSKGTVQFPHDQPLPLDLIGRIVSSRVVENQKKFEAKRKKG